MSGAGGWALNRAYYAVVVILIAAIDQGTKYIALRTLGLEDRSVTVIPGLLWFEVIKNTGAAFGMFQQLGPLLAVITVVLIYAGYKIVRHEDDPVLLWALTLILGGASGNLIDRLFRGGVIDFIRVPNWPLFNVADCAITVGAVVVLFYGFSRRSVRSEEN